MLWRGLFTDLDTDEVMADLKIHGSAAAPGFMNPEGIVIFHLAGNVGFKQTILKDDEPKGMQK